MCLSCTGPYWVQEVSQATPPLLPPQLILHGQGHHFAVCVHSVAGRKHWELLHCVFLFSISDKHWTEYSLTDVLSCFPSILTRGAALAEEIMLPGKWSRDDLKSSDNCAIVFILQVVRVLEFCICRSASLSVLCFWRTLTFSFAALAAFAGWVELTRRLWGLVVEKACLFLFICESVCLTEKSWYLQLLTVLISWVRFIGLYLGNIHMIVYRLQFYISKLYVRRKAVFQSPFPATDFNASCFQNWERNKFQERCSL